MLKDAKILFIDDDAMQRSVFQAYMEDFYHFETAASGQVGIDLLGQSAYDLVLLDLNMPGLGGIETLKIIKKEYPSVDVVMLTMVNDVSSVVEAMKNGASDYVEKQKPRELIKMAIDKALESREKNQQLAYFRREYDEGALYQKIIGKSGKVKELISMIKTVKGSCSPMLITGENGTGKELVAEILTKQEGFGKRLQYSVNCGNFTRELIESELFGHVKGAFTGAISNRAGLFEQAHGHDVFLDEIGELPLELQPRLLRAVEEKEIKPVGADKIKKVNFRLICATNRDLEKMVKEGTFREDLFYRINVINIKVPPLRERSEDIPLLAEYFLKFLGHGKKEISPEVMEIFQQYDWPGNIRQLRNTIEIMALRSGSANVLEYKLTPINIATSPHVLKKRVKSNGDGRLHTAIEEIEKEIIKDALIRNDWVVTKTADDLGIHRNSLMNKLKEWGWEKPHNAESEGLPH